ncbi:hypothetical protein CBR_g41271 [Chara braunii]|uniref:Reverse transcriptase/retrotransposon-derived protein RNase H-like domain-containing protein n=1 Tax=Chara braunii TaxID=69332 RepID=A0A388LVC0_CHABU|nr:hypothetical protein CBR_g41271 [Chara braunii]|eukprot:GBG86277.1 hypothetical protein CBR_g41271 [Chara braunii]
MDSVLVRMTGNVGSCPCSPRTSDRLISLLTFPITDDDSVYCDADVRRALRRTEQVCWQDPPRACEIRGNGFVLIDRFDCLTLILPYTGFKVALEKSEFFLSEISFLGYIVTVDGLKPDLRKVAEVQDAPAPITLTQVRAFLGLASYYRRFIKGFAGIAKPLTNLLKKKEQLIWTPECEAAFQALKEALTSALVLARPDPTRPFALYTDWQPQAISAVLTQHDKDEREHVIEYASKTLSQAQANYEACKGECLAVVWGIQHFRPLYSQKFVLLTEGPYPMREFSEYLVELNDMEPLPFADEDVWELHRALYKSVALGMFRFFVDYEDHAIREHFVVYYVIAWPKPAEKEGTVALYPFAPLQTIDLGLLELIHLELLSIAQVIASEEEEIQPRLRTATAPRRTYNVVVIADYIAQRAERLEDFPEERPLHPPSSYPRPSPPKGPKKTPKRKRRHPSPGAQGNRIGGGEEVVQPARTRISDLVPGSAATLVKETIVPSPPIPRVPDLNLDGAGPSSAAAAGGGSRMGFPDPISRPPKKIEEEMVKEKERLKKEEEEKLKAVEEEEEVEEPPLERRRTGGRGESNGTKEDQMEKKITEWVAGLSLGEEEKALMYVTKEKQEAPMREWDAKEDPLKRQAIEDEKMMEWKFRLMREKKRRMEAESQAPKELEEVKKQRAQMATQVDLLGKMEIMARNIERLAQVHEKQYLFGRGHDIVLRSIRLRLRDFARELAMQVDSEVKARLEGTKSYCTGAIEGARLTAPKEEEARPRREPVKVKFPDSYSGKKEENFDNW